LLLLAFADVDGLDLVGQAEFLESSPAKKEATK
jgi:hypothetical protein